MISIRRGKRGEIPPAGGWRYLDALPGGPCETMERQLRPDGRQAVSGFGPLRKQAFDGPKTQNSRLLSQPAAVHRLAERARFELAIPFWGTHAFQACLFSHSSISPIRTPIRIRGLSVKPDCKGNDYFWKNKDLSIFSCQSHLSRSTGELVEYCV